MAPKNVLSSSVKKMDFVVRDISKKMYIGQDLMGKNLIYGIKEEGLAIAEYKDNESLVSRQVYDKTMAKQRDLAAERKLYHLIRKLGITIKISDYRRKIWNWKIS